MNMKYLLTECRLMILDKPGKASLKMQNIFASQPDLAIISVQLLSNVPNYQMQIHQMFPFELGGISQFH
jgi:hypothetical protein